MSRSGNEKAVGAVPEVILMLPGESCDLARLSREARFESDILLPKKLNNLEVRYMYL